jgi:hypothetical protein
MKEFNCDATSSSLRGDISARREIRIEGDTPSKTRVRSEEAEGLEWDNSYVVNREFAVCSLVQQILYPYEFQVIT